MNSFQVKPGSKKPGTYCAVIIRQTDKSYILFFALSIKYISVTFKRNSKFLSIQRKTRKSISKSRRGGGWGVARSSFKSLPNTLIYLASQQDILFDPLV